MPITGAEIRRIRGAMGLTQLAFAALLGTASNTVARWERNEKVASEPIALLIACLADKHRIKARVTKKAAKTPLRKG